MPQSSPLPWSQRHQCRSGEQAAPAGGLWKEVVCGGIKDEKVHLMIRIITNLHLAWTLRSPLVFQLPSPITDNLSTTVQAQVPEATPLQNHDSIIHEP